MADNLNFHETFQPEMVYIARILELAADEFEGDKYRISEVTGIPTGEKKGKVEPHIKYSNYMGLVEYTNNRGVYSLSLTKLGAEIWQQDRYMHEELTLWLLHYCMTRQDLGAPQWSYLVRRIHEGFNTEISMSHITSMLQKDYGVSSSDAGKAVSVLKSSYTTGAFSNIQYLEWDEKLRFKEKSEDVQFQYLYAYALLNSWEKLFLEKKEITLTEISDILCIGKVFGLNDEELDSVLSTLADNGIISINRQLFPITIIRTSSSAEMLNNIYSTLM